MQRSREAAATDKATGLRAYDGAKAQPCCRFNRSWANRWHLGPESDRRVAGAHPGRAGRDQQQATKLQMVAMLQQAEQRLIGEQRRIRTCASLDQTTPPCQGSNNEAIHSIGPTGLEAWPHATPSRRATMQYYGPQGRAYGQANGVPEQPGEKSTHPKLHERARCRQKR